MRLGYIRYPAVLGGDLAGEVVEVGEDVTRLCVGDRVLGQAVGMDPRRNRASEGAFQHYTIVTDLLAAPIPASLAYEDACVLPLTLTTAATGLFHNEYLALKLPTAPASKPNGEALLVWAGASSVGSNAIQLASAAGYEVLTTASPNNFAYVQKLGASKVFDYHILTVVEDIILALKSKILAGALAIGNNGAESCVAFLEKCQGRKFVAMASFPLPEITKEGSGQTLRVFPVLLSVVWWQLSMWFKSRITGVTTSFSSAICLEIRRFAVLCMRNSCLRL